MIIILKLLPVCGEALDGMPHLVLTQLVLDVGLSNNTILKPLHTMTLQDFRSFATFEGGEGGRLRVDVPSVDENDGRRIGLVSVTRERVGGRGES